MKLTLAIFSFVLLIASTISAQSETGLTTNETVKTEQVSTDDQPTLSVSEEGKKEVEGKSKEECAKTCDHKEKASYHKNHGEMNKKECKPDCKKECCAKEEVKETDGTLEQE